MRNLYHNQHSHWYERNESIKLNTLKPKTHATVAIIVLATAILVSIFYYVKQVDAMVEIPTIYANAPQYKAPDEKAENNPTQEEIEKYIKTIFGKEARIAIAISHNECNPTNAKYPRCILHSDVEYSVGIFQINLYNSKQWIHAGRIPGTTMDEKAEWLKNPFNNTLYAYWVYQKSGWNPWSAYTSGNYLRSL